MKHVEQNTNCTVGQKLGIAQEKIWHKRKPKECSSLCQFHKNYILRCLMMMTTTTRVMMMIQRHRPLVK
jgi:hypothetical protein